MPNNLTLICQAKLMLDDVSHDQMDLPVSIGEVEGDKYTHDLHEDDGAVHEVDALLEEHEGVDVRLVGGGAAHELLHLALHVRPRNHGAGWRQKSHVLQTEL